MRPPPASQPRAPTPGPAVATSTARLDRRPREVGPIGGEVLKEAYDCHEIRTPVEEFEAYNRARLDALVRLGAAERAEITAAALELGTDVLRRTMGAVPARKKEGRA